MYKGGYQILDLGILKAGNNAITGAPVKILDDILNERVKFKPILLVCEMVDLWKFTAYVDIIYKTKDVLLGRVDINEGTIIEIEYVSGDTQITVHVEEY